MANSSFKLDNAGIYDVTEGPKSVTIGEARRLGKEIVTRSKVYVGVKTGRLRNKISYSVKRTSSGFETIVVADTHYALMHHEGTRPHRVTSNNARVMRFKSGGRVVYARRVFHPGTRPNPFLVRAMREAVH